MDSFAEDILQKIDSEAVIINNLSRNINNKKYLFMHFDKKIKGSKNSTLIQSVLEFPRSNDYIDFLTKNTVVEGVVSLNSFYSISVDKKNKFYVVNRSYLDGMSLSQIMVPNNVLQTIPYTKKEQISIQEQLHEMVDKIHESEYAGLDIRSSNVLMHNDKPQLFDFDFVFPKLQFSGLYKKLKDDDKRDVDDLFTRLGKRSHSDLRFSEFYCGLNGIKFDSKKYL